MPKKCHLLVVSSVCIISYAQTPVDLPEKDKISFSQLFSMGSDYFEYAARRKSAGKMNEFSTLHNFLGKYLNLTPTEGDQIMTISAEYGHDIKDLDSECRYWEITLLNRGGKNTLGPPSWMAHGFPVKYQQRRDEILIKYVNKLRLAFGDNKFNEFKSDLYYKMSKFYGDILFSKNRTK